MPAMTTIDSVVNAENKGARSTYRLHFSAQDWECFCHSAVRSDAGG